MISKLLHITDLPEYEQKLLKKWLLLLLLGGIIGFMPGLIKFIIAVVIIGYAYIVIFKIKKLHKHQDYPNIKEQELQILLKQ